MKNASTQHQPVFKLHLVRLPVGPPPVVLPVGATNTGDVKNGFTVNLREYKIKILLVVHAS